LTGWLAKQKLLTFTTPLALWIIPTSIATPEGNWHEKGKTGFCQRGSFCLPDPNPLASPDVSGPQLQGKSRFYAEYIRLSYNLVRGQLFNHGELQLSSRPEDYGDMWVYSGPSSSNEMNSVKEGLIRLLFFRGRIKLPSDRQRGPSHD
jgi:hypothetical protein